MTTIKDGTPGSGTSNEDIQYDPCSWALTPSVNLRENNETENAVLNLNDSGVSLQSISTESGTALIMIRPLRRSIPPPPPVVVLSSPAVVVPTASFSSDNEVVSSFLQPPHHA